MTERKKTGKALSPAAAKVRKHLEAMTPEGMDQLTHKSYMKRTHHYDCPRTIFGMEKGRAKRLAGLTFKKVAPRKPREAKPIVVKGGPWSVDKFEVGGRDYAAPKSFEILATIELAPYSTMGVGLLRTFTEELLAQTMPDGKRVQVRMLADPEAMEIRRPV